MRDNTKAFCRIVAQSFDALGPVYEFGSFQTGDPLEFAELWGYFPGRKFVGRDLQADPGVDSVDDLSDIFKADLPLDITNSIPSTIPQARSDRPAETPQPWPSRTQRCRGPNDWSSWGSTARPGRSSTP